VGWPGMQVDGVRRIDANDLDASAAAAVRRNLEYNDPRASGLVRPTQGDARLIALQVTCSAQTLHDLL
jgi:tRNA G37 N-methylase Trm5